MSEILCTPPKLSGSENFSKFKHSEFLLNPTFSEELRRSNFVLWSSAEVPLSLADGVSSVGEIRLIKDVLWSCWLGGQRVGPRQLFLFLSGALSGHKPVVLRRG